MLSGSGSYSGQTFINAGTLALSGVGSVPATTNIYVAPRALFDVTGAINNGNFTLTGNGKLWGSGACYGLLALTNGATLSPGSNNTFGTLVFTNFFLSQGRDADLEDRLHQHFQNQPRAADQ